MHPIIAPVKKAIYRPVTILGNPKTKPIKNANFTSPNPIPLPFVPRNKARKNKHVPSPDKRCVKNKEL